MSCSELWSSCSCKSKTVTDTVNFLLPPQCPSKTFGGFDTTKDLPDDVVQFARSHPAMFNPVYPINNRPIIVKTDVDYQFTQIVVDKVEAEDGQYDVMFIGTGKASKKVIIYLQTVKLKTLT